MSLSGPRRGFECRSLLETISIAEVADARAELEAECFTAAEREELKSRHVQSVAGGLALKRALCALFKLRFADQRVGPADFVLHHDANGAPRVTVLPPPWPALAAAGRERLFVSISHTKLEAAGLVVLEQELERAL